MKIDLALIQQLRDRTGIGMMDCKKALIEAGGDIDKAVEILRKKGIAVASKRAGNETGQGIVHAYIHPGATLGVLIEINCETDFVARTKEMAQFAHDVCMHIAASKPLFVSEESVDENFVKSERAIFVAQLMESGKPEAMIQSIVDGKVKKMYADICLLRQKFVKNDQITIDDLLKELIAKMGENIKIRRFALFQVAA